MKKFIMVIVISLLRSGLFACKKEDNTLLKIQYLPELDFSQENDEQKINCNKIDLEIGDIPEMTEQKYAGQKELEIFTDYIRDDLKTEITDKWLVTVHYFDEGRTTGMVKFLYAIGNIRTDRTVVFNLTDGKADLVYYRHLKDRMINEDDLLQRVEKFERKYNQEKKELKEGETLVKEDVLYTYHYATDQLVYSYNLFFSYSEHELINNDYGTVCLIDAEGNVKE